MDVESGQKTWLWIQNNNFQYVPFTIKLLCSSLWTLDSDHSNLGLQKKRSKNYSLKKFVFITVFFSRNLLLCRKWCFIYHELWRRLKEQFTYLRLLILYNLVLIRKQYSFLVAVFITFMCCSMYTCPYPCRGSLNQTGASDTNCFRWWSEWLNSPI